MAEQKTVIVLEVTHRRALPADLQDAIGKRVYDYVSAKTGDQVGLVFKDVVGLEVRQQ